MVEGQKTWSKSKACIMIKRTFPIKERAVEVKFEIEVDQRQKKNQVEGEQA